MELDDQWKIDPHKNFGFTSQFVHYVLTKRVVCNKTHEMWFKFEPARLSIQEFSLVMGLGCGQIPLALREEAKQVRLSETYWKTNVIRPPDLLSKIQKWPRGMPQEDKLKIAMLYFLESMLLSSDPKKLICQDYMSMVDE